MELEEMTKISDKQEKNKNDGARKDDADETLGQDVQTNGCGDGPARQERRLSALPAVQEEVRCDGHPKSYDDIWNQRTREEVSPNRRQKENSRPKTGVGSKKTASELVEETCEQQNAEVKRETRGARGHAEELKGHGHAPVGQGCLFEVANAVFVKGDPVAAGEDFAARIGV